MGCNICRNNIENLNEEEFVPPPINNNQKDNAVLPSTSENKPELKKNISSPNLKIHKDNFNKENNNNIINKEEINGTNFIKKINENISNNKINNNNNSIIKENKENKNIINESKNISSNKNDYNSRVIELINEIRTNPSEYCNIIYNNLQYISKELKIVANDETGQNEEKEEIFFQKKVKVKLYNGERAFIEAADYLKYMNPMNELIVKDEIKLNMPNNEEEMNDNSFIKKQLIDKRKNNYNINAFFKDSVKNPEVGVLLMIVGDYNNSQNKKRKAILNPEYKYIAVNSKFMGDLFIAYYTFSK